MKSRHVSERRACRVIVFGRSAAWRWLKAHNNDASRRCPKALADRYPRYGYPALHDMLSAEGQVVNPKRPYRI